MKQALLLLCLFPLYQAGAQNPEPERLLDFKVEVDDNQYQFSPIMPPLIQKPGAPEAYWSYFWEFGDGSFSREENPKHAYARQGDYMVSLDATAHYDNGKRSKRNKKPTSTKSRITHAPSPQNHVFEPETRQMVALYSYSKPKAEEEITLVLSYRNLGLVNTDGRLHLFFNEKKFPSSHFDFLEARTHYGETADMSLSQWSPADPYATLGWTALNPPSTGGVSGPPSGDSPPSLIIQEMLNESRGLYRKENAWKFSNLQPGESRNMFISLAGTKTMLQDTNAFIHLTAIFAPFDPLVAPEKFEYEIEIVSSHDPNAIAVSDNRVNYRLIGSKKLDYKVQFQNNGEGPASTVALTVEVPKGLKLDAMQPVSWYPKCPICPKTPNNMSCLDTSSTDGTLEFTFRNIYLPGSRQDGVENRDSTKGFVKYRITADRKMPKRPFRSRAKIVFDKNPPIYTNYTKTGFKVGKSPGLKVGYGFTPKTSSPEDADNVANQGFNNGYFFLGSSLSPYKSWRIYPQAEILAGIKGREKLPEAAWQTLVLTQPNNGIAELDSIVVDTVKTSSRGFVSFELPVLLRKNFNQRVGIGLGASARVILENGEDKIESSRTTIDWEFIDSPTGVLIPIKKADQGAVETNIEAYKSTSFRYSLFADLTLGSVRAGPNLGLRSGVVFGEKGKPRPFVQLSLELKL